MIYIYSFLFAGFVSMIGQFILDNTKLTPGHITSLFVIIGASLDIFNIYDLIVAHVGAGALVPITSFGHLIMHGAMQSTTDYGVMGLFMGMFNLIAAGVSSAIIFSSSLVAIFFASCDDCWDR